MSTVVLRKYLDIISEAESATQISDFTQQALASGIAEILVGGDPRKYHRFTLYFAPLISDGEHKQVDIRIKGSGANVSPVDSSVATIDSLGKLSFDGDMAKQSFLNQHKFTDPQKELIKDYVFKMMHPATTRGGSGTYQQVSGYKE